MTDGELAVYQIGGHPIEGNSGEDLAAWVGAAGPVEALLALWAHPLGRPIVNAVDDGYRLLIELIDPDSECEVPVDQDGKLTDREDAHDGATWTAREALERLGRGFMFRVE